MENSELRELKMELYKEVGKLVREYKSFKRRICIIANLFIPGIGFILHGRSFLKGAISFILFVSYNFLFFFKILPNTDIGYIYYIPAIII